MEWSKNDGDVSTGMREEGPAVYVCVSGTGLLKEVTSEHRSEAGRGA